MPNTSHQDSHQNITYTSFIEQFDGDNLQSQILTGDHQKGMNAYIECCGRHAQSDKANKIALVYENLQGNITRFTYAQLDQLSAKMANLLLTLGIKKGDRIATMLPRTPELLTVILGAWRIGAVYQPLFTAFGFEAIDYRLQKANTQVVFTDVANREKFNELKQSPQVILVGTPKQASEFGDLHFDSQLSQQTSDCPPMMLTSEDPFLQMFTSGTVGKSKGVAVPLKALLAFYLYMYYAVGLREADNFWNMADPGWAYGLYYAVTGPLLMGATTHFNEAGFSAQNTFDFLQRHQITNLASSPTAFRMMKSSGIFDNQTNNFKQLRMISSAGEPLNTEVVSWVKANLDTVIMDHYGQTETGMTCCCHHSLEHATPTGSMGLPLAGYRLAVLDDDGNELGIGEKGQLAVDVANSPSFFFQGYTWQEKDPFIKGYYLTGDVVEQHDDGTFWFSGRDDDIITTAGYRVGPTDVENTVLEHSAVAESAAVGIPDELRGEIIKAYIVLKSGYVGNDELADEIKKLVHRNLSAHAYPREIAFVDSLPKTPSGKIQRFMLRNLNL